MRKGARGEEIVGSPEALKLKAGGTEWGSRGNYPRFMVDNMMMRTAKWLRNVGIDAEFQEKKDYERIIRGSVGEAVKGGGVRIIITSDRKLCNTRAMNSIPWLWLPSKDPKSQVALILEFFECEIDPRLYMTRCVECNSGGFLLKTRDDVTGRVPEGVRSFYDEFWECPGCHKVFWEGTGTLTLTLTLIVGLLGRDR